ncbi:calcium-dependent protein kinase 24-like [Diospyros lotus]|uniref:calcium-dependent protein kinase 24-like n=1 Tax=Diospyros lotus TaxID=55363 RepID=UPI002254B691|nr:calcium-dependent protein kinase 24-like [Diospyros lotus]
MGGCTSVDATFFRQQYRRSKRCLPSTGRSFGSRRSKFFKVRVSQKTSTVVKDPCRGDIFKRYHFEKELGRGEFGVTYRCHDRITGERVACKRISKSKLKTETDVEDVRREVDIMRHLPEHPNIVQLKEAYEDNEAVYLVMELCHGGELFDRIVARGHYTERGAAIVTKTILQAIQVCHKHGVLHRDLKPENFLYANEHENAPLKAIDFGLSVFYHPGQRFNEIVGSPYYMAPEVLRRDYGPQVDTWSAGVILYILLCGVPPFLGETDQGTAEAIIRGKINFHRDPWPRVSEDAKELVKAMLDPNPYSRMTVEEAMEHRWIHNAHQVPNIPLGENVRTRIKQFSLMNKFKKKVLRVVADNLPYEKVAAIKEMFHTMDTNKDGVLTFQELKAGLHKIGHQIADNDVQMLIDAADVDGNGVLNCEEFVTMSVHLKRIGNDDELLRQAFRYFDKNDNGYIEFDELRQDLLDDDLDSNNNNNSPDQLVRDIILDVDLDKDGRISYKEFEAMMTAGVEWRMGSRRYSKAKLNAVSQKLFKDKAY